MKRNAFRLTSLSLAAAGLASLDAAAATRIEGVYVDREARVLYIDGVEFRSTGPNAPMPFVTIGGRRLQPAPGSTDSHIEAPLPDDVNVDAGDIFVARTDGLAAGADPARWAPKDQRATAAAAAATGTFINSWRGAFNPATTYNSGDLAYSAGSTWLCAAPTTCPPSAAPAQPPWSLVAKAGATGPKGPAGPKGATGAAGSPGPAGVAGAAGATGPQGPAGATGATGSNGAPGATGATGAKGATGVQGVAGATGPIGPQGPVGATGSIGPQGVPGTPGTKGATGATGSPGVAGPTGATGPAGAASLAGVSSRCYSFTFEYACGQSGYNYIGGSPVAVTLQANQGVLVMGSVGVYENAGGDLNLAIGICASTDPTQQQMSVFEAPVDVYLKDNGQRRASPMSMNRFISAAALGGAGTYYVGMCYRTFNGFGKSDEAVVTTMVFNLP